VAEGVGPEFKSQYHKKKISKRKNKYIYFAVVELELRAYTCSHSTSPIFVKGFLR
jgi:hypothetical protein